MAIIKVHKILKVAKIIDEYTIVINGGSESGICVGDLFEIYSPGVSVNDPDTGESLGNIDFIKAKIVAKDVFPKMSICTSQAAISSIVSSLSAAMLGRPAELNVAAEDISGGYDDSDAEIRVGDLVRKTGSAQVGTKPILATD